MNLLVILPITLLVLVLCVIVYRQYNLDGVESLFMRWFDTGDRFTVAVYNTETNDHELTLMVVRDRTRPTELVYDNDNKSYVLSLGTNPREPHETHMRALEALQYNQIQREGKEHVLYKDLEIIRMIMTDTVDPRFNEQTKDQFEIVRKQYVHFLDSM